MRTDSPFELDFLNYSDVQSFAAPRVGEKLLVATAHPHMMISLSSYPMSNVTAKILRVG